MVSTSDPRTYRIERLDQSPPGHPAVDRSSALLGLLGHLHAGATKKCQVWPFLEGLGFSSDDSTMEKGVERRPLPYDELSPGVVRDHELSSGLDRIAERPL